MLSLMSLMSLMSLTLSMLTCLNHDQLHLDMVCLFLFYFENHY